MDDSDSNEDRRDDCLNSDGGYEVGYRKPPKATRFRRGQSGKPRGRPRGSKSWKTVADEELSKRITVLEGGKPKQITWMRAVVKRAIKDAVMKGDVRMLKELGGLSEPPMPEPVEELGKTHAVSANIGNIRGPARLP